MKKIMHTKDIVLMNVTAIIGLRWLPIAASYGASSIVLWVLAAIIFFIPLGIIATELATTWPEEGGIYMWVKHAYGEKPAFMVSWFYWANCFFYLPSLLTFTAVTLAYLFKPELAANKYFTCSVVLVSLWGVTLANLKGTRILKWFADTAGVFGILLPGLIIIVLGFAAVFIWQHPIPTEYSWATIWPSFTSKANIVFFSALMFSMAGVELTPILAGETADPQRTFPRAILISAILIVVTYIVGTIAITFIIPPAQITASAGIMDAVQIVCAKLHLNLLMKIIAVMIVVSGMGGASVWAIVPVKMFIESCKHGILPKFFTRLNKDDIPANTILLQSAIVSLVVISTSFLSTVNQFYEILVLMGSITYFIPYIGLFFSFAKLRKIQPDKVRPYRVPGGAFGKWASFTLGLFSVTLAIVLPFFVHPGDVVSTKDLFFYHAIVISGPIIFGLIGYLIYFRYEKHKKLGKVLGNILH